MVVLICISLVIRDAEHFHILKGKKKPSSELSGEGVKVKKESSRKKADLWCKTPHRGHRRPGLLCSAFWKHP